MGKDFGHIRLLCPISSIQPVTKPPPTAKSWKKLRTNLAAWYQAAKRDLPWRRTSDPYAITVSEIMLHPTQVVTVIPYYEHWIRLFSTWQSLAKAHESAVIKAWEGLGYYRRARNLPEQSGEGRDAPTGGKMPAERGRAARAARHWALHGCGNWQHRLRVAAGGAGWKCHACAGAGAGLKRRHHATANPRQVAGGR